MESAQSGWVSLIVWIINRSGYYMFFSKTSGVQNLCTIVEWLHACFLISCVSLMNNELLCMFYDLRINLI